MMSCFVATEIQQRLLARLEYIKIQPQHILVVTHEECDWLNIYPDAHITCLPETTSLSHHLATVPLNHIDIFISNLNHEIFTELETLGRLLEERLAPGGLWLFTSLGARTTLPTHTFDMRQIADVLLHLGFQDPVVDTEDLEVVFPQGKQAQLEALYQRHSVPDTIAPQHSDRHETQFTFEIIYGAAWCKTTSLAALPTSVTHI